MNDLTFDQLTRRSSIAALGAAGLVGLLAKAPTTSAEQSANKKANEKARKKCKNQVNQCVGSASVFCGDNQECRADFLVCCEELDDCNFSGFFVCAFNSVN